MLQKVSMNFQITLPTEFRKRFDVHEGDLLEVVEQDDGVIVRPVDIESNKKQVLEELQESYAKLSDNPYANMPEEEVMEMLNEARRQYREEKKAKAQVTAVY